MNAEKTRARFAELRNKYFEAKVKRDLQDGTLRSKYGAEYQASWLKAGERKLKERLQAALDRAGEKLTDFIATFSPRDWHHGVPVVWVREDLTFEDAARPANEPLSVRPPLSYGSTVRKT